MYQKKQERLVVGLSGCIIVAAIVSTLYITGSLEDIGSPEANHYANVTFTDAVMTCEELARGKYKSSLNSLTVDDHSSRFDLSVNTYKIFFEAKMASRKNENGTSDFFINCYVSGNKGRVTGLEIYENKESATEVLRKDEGGLFGWPIKK